MNEAVQSVIEKRIRRAMAAVQRNQMQAFYCERADQVPAFVKEMLPAGCSVSHGGSATLSECGVTDLLAQGDYRYLDRSKASGPEEIGKLYREVFSADWYLTSSNAVTEDGKLYNVDGNSNRVAAIAFGPAHVLVIVGCNKIVRDLDEAMARVQTIAAPANTVRLNCDTPCAESGRCQNCHSPARICCNALITAFQRDPDRIKVLFVGEPLGF